MLGRYNKYNAQNKQFIGCATIYCIVQCKSYRGNVCKVKRRGEKPMEKWNRIELHGFPKKIINQTTRQTQRPAEIHTVSLVSFSVSLTITDLQSSITCYKVTFHNPIFLPVPSLGSLLRNRYTPSQHSQVPQRNWQGINHKVSQ